MPPGLEKVAGDLRHAVTEALDNDITARGYIREPLAAYRKIEIARYAVGQEDVLLGDDGLCAGAIQPDVLGALEGDVRALQIHARQRRRPPGADLDIDVSGRQQANGQIPNSVRVSIRHQRQVLAITEPYRRPGVSAHGDVPGRVRQERERQRRSAPERGIDVHSLRVDLDAPGHSGEIRRLGERCDGDGAEGAAAGIADLETRCDVVGALDVGQIEIQPGRCRRPAHVVRSGGTALDEAGVLIEVIGIDLDVPAGGHLGAGANTIGPADDISTSPAYAAIVADDVPDSVRIEPAVD